MRHRSPHAPACDQEQPPPPPRVPRGLRVLCVSVRVRVIPLPLVSALVLFGGARPGEPDRNRGDRRQTPSASGSLRRVVRCGCLRQARGGRGDRRWRRWLRTPDFFVLEGRRLEAGAEADRSARRGVAFLDRRYPGYLARIAARRCRGWSLRSSAELAARRLSVRGRGRVVQRPVPSGSCA